jgi:hypothetical protein
MPTLDELLTDTALTDDIKITLPGGKEVTVGALRTFATQQKEIATAAQREYEAKRKESDAAKARAEALAKDALQLWEAADKRRASPSEAAPNPNEPDWDNDPVYRPIGQRLTKLEKEVLAAQQAEIKQLSSALAEGFKFVTEDYNQRRWDALPKDQRPKDKTWRDFMESAKTQNIRDSYGLFDPIEAYTRSTSDDRRAADIKAAEARGAKAAEERLKQTMIPRPGSTPQASSKREPAPFKDLSEALNAAKMDPEILRIANGEDALA